MYIYKLMKRSSSHSFLEKRIYQKLDNIKFSKRPKVSADEFYIPSMENYTHILNYNYNVSQLRAILLFYKQKRSGNKRQLVYRLYNFLRFSRYAVKIQSLCRGYMRRLYNNLQGPAWRDRKCINSTDFLSLSNIGDIAYCQFCSYRCPQDKKVYGFDIKSLYNLIKKNSKRRNPYSRAELPKTVVTNIHRLMRVGKILQEPVTVIIVDGTLHLSLEKKIALTALSLFQKLDSLGYTTDAKWLLDLSKSELVKFIKDLSDIWTYRSELSIGARKNICPPHGNPFIGIILAALPSMNTLTLQRTALCIIENIITKSTLRETQALGALYVLGALTIVNTNAAASLPWLAESFHNSNPTV